MTEAEYQQMLADRDAGTEGAWHAHQDGAGVWGVRADDWSVVPFLGYDDAEADARRIARLPDLEAEVIRLREELLNIQAESRNHADAIRMARIARHGED